MPGRIQRGARIDFPLPLPGLADALPTLTIIGPGPATLGSWPMPFVGSSTYEKSLRLPGGLALGIYQVTYSYLIGGVPGSSSDSFTLVAGGDSGGEIISLFGYDRPEGRYILAQLGGGRLVQGRDPYL